MSERYDLENALLRVEKASREVLDAAGADESHELRAALDALDSLRDAIRARRRGTDLPTRTYKIRDGVLDPSSMEES